MRPCPTSPLAPVTSTTALRATLTPPEEAREPGRRWGGPGTSRPHPGSRRLTVRAPPLLCPKISAEIQYNRAWHRACSRVRRTPRGRIPMIARDVMTANPLTVTPEASVAEVWDL